MVYSISASLYYSTISTLSDHPIFQSIIYLVCLKKLNFVGFFNIFHYLAKTENLLEQLYVLKFNISPNHINKYILINIIKTTV